VSAFFVTGCDGGEIFQSIYGAFADISDLVSPCIEARWGTASTPFLQAAFSRNQALRTDAPDASGLNLFR
jgi:hypothetical protein